MGAANFVNEYDNPISISHKVGFTNEMSNSILDLAHMCVRFVCYRLPAASFRLGCSSSTLAMECVSYRSVALGCRTTTTHTMLTNAATPNRTDSDVAILERASTSANETDSILALFYYPLYRRTNERMNA